MPGITVQVSGLKELDEALGQLPKATAKNVLKRTLEKAAAPIVEEAKQLVPVYSGPHKENVVSGALRDSIVASTKTKNTVGNAEYSAAMRDGLGKEAARAALISARRAASGAGSFVQLFIGPARGKGVIRYAHIVEFGSISQSPHPYMRPAWDARKDEALSIIKDELANQIILAARRIGRSKKQSDSAKYSASSAALYAAGY